jgi:hypothetical protein
MNGLAPAAARPYTGRNGLIMKAFALSAALLLVAAHPALAQQVDLRIENGLVTLRAQNAAPRAILDAWARVGGTTVVNGDQLAGGLVTLQIDAMPEADALDIVLRDASGYISAPRRAGNPGASTFDRIVVLASSDAPAAVRRPPTQPRQGPAITPVPEVRQPTNVPQPPTVGEDPQLEPPAPATAPPQPSRPVNPFFPAPQQTTPGFGSDRPGIITPVPEG